MTNAIFEFRDYTLQPGQRDVLIELFEREFIESQEALGCTIVATFRDLDRPDRFVWIRSFADMQTRATALDGFYTGPTWRAHRSAANATIIDSDNVLLLRPHGGDAARHTAPRAPIGSVPPQSLILATIYHLEPGADGAEIAPLLRDHRAAPFATFATEHSPNSYPRLPVRENDTVFVSLTHFASASAHEAIAHNLAASQAPGLISTEFRRLQPTARSQLR